VRWVEHWHGLQSLRAKRLAQSMQHGVQVPAHKHLLLCCWTLPAVHALWLPSAGYWTAFMQLSSAVQA
jgi:hypothetical protein